MGFVRLSEVSILTSCSASDPLCDVTRLAAAGITDDIAVVTLDDTVAVDDTVSDVTF